MEKQGLMLRSTGIYKNVSKNKSHNKDQTQNSSKLTFQKKVHKIVSKERKATSFCFICAKNRYLPRNCPYKQDEGNWKVVKKKSTSNRDAAASSVDEVNISSMEIET